MINIESVSSERYLRSVFEVRYPGNARRPGLSEDQQKELAELRKTDRDIKTHEEAHLRAGGVYARTPRYTFKTGPDGNQYALQGTTQIVFQEGNTPEETVKIAETIRKAALAPANPSNEDLRVAAEASRMEAKARMEISKNRQAELKEYVDNFKNSREKIKEGRLMIEKPVKVNASTKVLGMKVAVPEISDPYTAPSLPGKGVKETDITA